MTLLYLLLFTSAVMLSQGSIGVAIYQNVNLAFGGDEEQGDEGFTTDIRTRLKLEGLQKRHGYLVVGAVFEYADSHSGDLGDFYKYGAELGYTLTPLETVYFTPTVGYGRLWRKNDYVRVGWEFSGEVTFNTTKNFKINLLSTIMQRPDLQKKNWGVNGYAGLQYSFDTDYMKKRKEELSDSIAKGRLKTPSKDLYKITRRTKQFK